MPSIEEISSDKVDNVTALLQTTGSGDVSEVKALIASSTVPVDAEEEGSGVTALCIASGAFDTNDFTMMRLLAGTNLLARKVIVLASVTSLCGEIADRGSEELVVFLLSLGANPNKRFGGGIRFSPTR
jgi:hypothetical protein